MTTTSANWTGEKQEKAHNILPGLMIIYGDEAKVSIPENDITTTSVVLTGDKQDRAHSILSGLTILL
jgi:hypothetical protein